MLLAGHGHNDATLGLGYYSVDVNTSVGLRNRAVRAHACSSIRIGAALARPRPADAPGDVAETCLYLAFDAARFVIGTVLPADGGTLTQLLRLV